MRAANRGDMAAYHRLLAGITPVLRRVVRARGAALGPEGCEDVLQDVLLAIGEGPLVSVIVMQALAFVLSVCSTVDSFLALAFYGTFTGGSVVAFLTFGPMVDIKSAMMFLGIFKRRVVFYLILLPFLMTLLIGLWMNLFVQF